MKEIAIIIGLGVITYIGIIYFFAWVFGGMFTSAMSITSASYKGGNDENS